MFQFQIFKMMINCVYDVNSFLYINSHLWVLVSHFICIYQNDNSTIISEFITLLEYNLSVFCAMDNLAWWLKDIRFTYLCTRITGFTFCYVKMSLFPICLFTGIFKIEDSARVARLWGKRKNRPAMNYDKLSRSIRQYYKKGIIQKTEHSKRLVYQFCKPYLMWRGRNRM